MEVLGARRIWRRIDQLEQRVCVRVNRGSRRPVTRHLFIVVSRLGDGVFWYALVLALALSGPEGAMVALRMACAAIAGLLLYRQLKHRLVRERPYISHGEISLGTAPLDRYSFPSGHTLHAVMFTVIATEAVPELAIVLFPFTLLIAMSRVALGLHYPTDVAAGAVIGWVLAVIARAV